MLTKTHEAIIVEVPIAVEKSETSLWVFSCLCSNCMFTNRKTMRICGRPRSSLIISAANLDCCLGDRQTDILLCVIACAHLPLLFACRGHGALELDRDVSSFALGKQIILHRSPCFLLGRPPLSISRHMLGKSRAVNQSEFPEVCVGSSFFSKHDAISSKFVEGCLEGVLGGSGELTLNTMPHQATVLWSFGP